MHRRGERGRWFGWGLAGLVALELACDAGQPPEAITTIELVMEQAPASSDVRVALLWSHADAEGDLHISDDHPWPADSERMLFPLTELPEQASFFDWADEEGALAVGGLLVYKDRDGDKAFTRTRLGEPFQDHVVGWSPGLRVISALEEPRSSKFSPGITLHQTRYVDGLVTESSTSALGDIAIAIEVFEAPQAQCLGLSPLVSEVSEAVDTRFVSDPWPDSPLGDTGLPLVAGIPDCGFSFEERPEGWETHSARCRAGAERLFVARYVETPLEGLAAMCGRQVSRCEISLDSGLPDGICSSGL